MAMSASVAELGFRRKLQAALDACAKILEANRHPQLANEVHHGYTDKFLLVEFLGNAALASTLNSLAVLGLDQPALARIRDWAGSSAVSLQFRAEEHCTFDKMVKRDVENPTRRVEELSVGGAVRAALTSKVVTTVEDFYWVFEASYEVTAVRGVGSSADDRLRLSGGQGRHVMLTSTNSPPRAEAKVPAVMAECSLTWLLQQLQPGSDGSPCPRFAVDRDDPKTATPRRNPSAEAAQTFFNRLAAWAYQIERYLRDRAEVAVRAGDPPGVVRPRLDLTSLNSSNVFVPVLPLLEDRTTTAAPPALSAEPEAKAGDGAAEETPAPAASLPGLLVSVRADLGTAALAAGSSSVLSAGDVNTFLLEERRTLGALCDDLSQVFPTDDSLLTALDAVAVVTLAHVQRVCEHLQDGLTFVEDMLRQQLVAAIGKQVTPSDFGEYMTFHNRRLFAPHVLPKPFCFAVRRSPAHSPEGTVSVERGTDAVVTVSAEAGRAHPMTFALNAAANVTFGGERFLHAWLDHSFAGSTSGVGGLQLVARARQFSSFVVLVGRIGSATTFEPIHAAIVQNKDEVTVPLELSTLPTAQEFKDAIESLSPEQQTFARAFRAMQLESTLFGVLLLQIKPQLERVLHLTDDSLTKEIKLTQDLMDLFIKYQIPTDLLSHDPTETDASPAQRLHNVKQHVAAIHDMIEDAKRQELHERRREVEYEAPFALAGAGMVAAGGAPPPAGAFGFGGGPSSAMTAMQSYSAQPTSTAAFGAAPAMAVTGFGGGGGGGATFGSAMNAMPPPPMAAAPLPVPAPPPPPPPQQQQQQQQQLTAEQPQPQAQQGLEEEVGGLSGGMEVEVDYTKVPAELDARFESLDSDSALRPTIINPGSTWTKRAQAALLAKPTTTTLGADDLKRERNAAFDLLDALTRSGALPVDHASLHVILAATHCFDESVIDTLVQRNINPIERVERSTLVMASTVHRKPVAELIQPAVMSRVVAASPMLFIEAEADA